MVLLKFDRVGIPWLYSRPTKVGKHSGQNILTIKNLKIMFLSIGNF